MPKMPKMPACLPTCLPACLSACLPARWPYNLKKHLYHLTSTHWTFTPLDIYPLLHYPLLHLPPPPPPPRHSKLSLIVVDWGVVEEGGFRTHSWGLSIIHHHLDTLPWVICDINHTSNLSTVKTLSISCISNRKAILHNYCKIYLDVQPIRPRQIHRNSMVCVGQGDFNIPPINPVSNFEEFVGIGVQAVFDTSCTWNWYLIDGHM